MKLLIVCVALSVCVAVGLASPVKTQVRDEAPFAESGELQISASDSSSEEEEVKEFNSQNTTKVTDISADGSEELVEKTEFVKDEMNENTSKEEQELDDDSMWTRNKRYVFYAPHASNQLLVKDEGTIKYEKYLKLSKKNFYNNNERKKRSADSSQENSSEEDDKTKSQAKSVAAANKPESVAAENLELAGKPGSDATEPEPAGTRRKRNSLNDDSSNESSSEEANQATPDKKPETKPLQSSQLDAKPDAAAAETSRSRRNLEDSSEEAHEENEVFILSQEKEMDYETNNDEHLFLSEAPESALEDKNSEEDYAQGCGGNRSDTSNENSNEHNETLNDNF